jgi:GTP-binding protein
MEQQTRCAIAEADAVVFMVDGRSGLTAADQIIASELRRYGKQICLAVNKTDGLEPAQAVADFYGLGLGEPQPVAAVHGRGVGQLIEKLFEQSIERAQAPGHPLAGVAGIRIAVVGRPNAGKSTLINRLVGAERVVVYDEPGTTRDSVFVPFERDGQGYTLIDTAGLRRRARVQETIEKFSVIKTLQAIDACNVVIHTVDAQRGLADQDLNILSFVLESGRALVVAVNKWDGLDPERRRAVTVELNRRLGFASFATTHFISALQGTGVGTLLHSVEQAYAAATRDLATPELTRLLEKAVSAHPPPMVRGRRIKLRYAHQGGVNPPVIVIHGNQTARLPESYRRYLINHFRDALAIAGTPLRLQLKGSENPYAGLRNTLTTRQQAKRKRLRAFVGRHAK